MKAYGSEKHEKFDDLTERSTGAPSKHRKMSGKHRTVLRRTMHKNARYQAKSTIQKPEIDA
jgi:hypothetical protein